MSNIRQKQVISLEGHQALKATLLEQQLPPLTEEECIKLRNSVEQRALQPDSNIGMYTGLVLSDLYGD